jgi:hypothetical protein
VIHGGFSQLLVWLVICLGLILNACGGGAATTGSSGSGSSGSGSGGGSGGLDAPLITEVSPSYVFTNTLLGEVDVYGTNISGGTVAVDGNAVPTFPNPDGSLGGEVSTTLFQTPGTHQITVVALGTSNALPLQVVAPPRGPQPFQAPSGYYAGGSNPDSIVVADFNGDGLGDVVVQGPGSDAGLNVAIFYGQKDGTLSAPQYVFGVAGDVIAAGDVDGNGTTDLVTFNYSGAQSSNYNVLLNDGSGNFHVASSGQIPSLYPGGMFGSLVLLDVNGDGKPDILVSGNNPDQIYVLINQGGGNFGNPISIAVPAGDNRIFAVADFNGDGFPDIAYNGTNAANGADQIHILINSGSGTFSDMVPSALQGVGGWVFAGDFNGDGRTDLVVESTNPSFPMTLASFAGLGNGNFTLVSQITIAPANFLEPYHLVTGDFDHDGFLDLAGADGAGEPSHVLYLWGDGAGNFTPQHVNGPQGFFVATGDINGDGIPDVVIPDQSQFVSVSLGQMGRNYPSPVDLQLGCACPLSAASTRGNGTLDLFSEGDPINDFPSTLYLNQGNDTFQFWGYGTDQQLLLADVNGDGIADLIGTDGQNLVIWPGLGNLAYGQPITIATPVPPRFGAQSLQVIDIDKDGQLDIVATGFIAFGQGNFQFSVVPAQISSPIVVGDFNNDGMLDIVDGFGVFMQGPARTFTLVPNPDIGEIQFLVAGDFNGDGNLDIATSLGGDKYIEIYYGRGDGTLWLQGMLNANEAIGGLVAVDFTGDGRPDIAAGLEPAHQIALFTNDGLEGFSLSYLASGAFAVQLIEASFNSANKPDLAVLNFGSINPLTNALVIFHQ